MIERPSRAAVLMTFARIIAQRGTCKRLKVGAVIAKEGRPITMGYNGSPSKQSHCNCDVDNPCNTAIHAEANAIYFAARLGIALENTTIYCTHAPCKKCSEAIIQSGITAVMYELPFRDTTGLDLLIASNIVVNSYAGELVSLD